MLFLLLDLHEFGQFFLEVLFLACFVGFILALLLLVLLGGIEDLPKFILLVSFLLLGGLPCCLLFLFFLLLAFACPLCVILLHFLCQLHLPLGDFLLLALFFQLQLLPPFLFPPFLFHYLLLQLFPFLLSAQFLSLQFLVLPQHLVKAFLIGFNVVKFVFAAVAHLLQHRHFQLLLL